MSTLVIVLGCMLLASSTVAVTEHDLVEHLRSTTHNLLHDIELSVEEHLRPVLVENATQRIAEMQIVGTSFVDNIRNKTASITSHVNTDVINPARLRNVNTTDCERLFDDLLSSTNASVAKANVCTADTISTLSKLIVGIELLTGHILYRIETTMTDSVDAPVVESIIEAIEKFGAVVNEVHSTLNEDLPKLELKINELKSVLNNHHVSDCSTNNKEYSIYNNTLSTIQGKIEKCIAEKPSGNLARLIAMSARALAEAMREFNDPDTIV